jgi:hypothetical protein
MGAKGEKLQLSFDDYTNNLITDDLFMQTMESDKN